MSTWFCLASGPSMCAPDAEAVRGRGHVIAINNTIELAPFADVLYSCDADWWRKVGVRYDWFTGRRIALDAGNVPDGVEAIPFRIAAGLGRECVHTGHNSGYQAINFAFLEDAKQIILLGYDMKNPGQHWHPPHGRGLGNFSPGMPELCIPQFAQLAHDLRIEGIEVINCTRDTALNSFPKQPLGDVLARL